MTAGRPRSNRRPYAQPKSDQIEKAKAFWRANPVEAVKDWFKATPDDHQAEILNDIFLRGVDRIAAKSAHGVGKTTTLAWAGWLFLNLFEYSRVVATAPTGHQLHNVLWPEYAKWHMRMPPALADQWNISQHHIRHIGKEGQTWFAVARTSNKAANLQGFHGTHLMIQGDEMSAIPQEVFEVMEGALSEVGEEGKIAAFVGMGNPNFTGGEFYDAFHKNKQLYARYTIAGDQSVLDMLEAKHGDYHNEHGRIYYSPRVTEKYRDTMARKYGRDSAVYDVRVRGIFPREDDNAVLPMAWVEAARQRALDNPPMFDRIADPVTIVMDIARGGADETVLAIIRGPHCIKMKTWAKTSTVQCEDIVVDECALWRSLGIEVARIIIDEPGVGGGVIDGIRRRDGIPCAPTPYNGGESMKQDRDPADDCRMFQNRRARDYWHVRRLLEQGLVTLPDDDDLVAQAATVLFDYNEREKIVVESKRKLKERLGDDASPDRVDAVVMGLAPWYSFSAPRSDIDPEDITFGDVSNSWDFMTDPIFDENPWD